jgi:DNA-binding NarL/FixJ family response regulator
VIDVVLADDQALVRAGFRALLRPQPDMQVVGEAEDGAAAVRLARETHPDVVLMDIRMPGHDGLTATRDIAADPQLSEVRVIVLTTFTDDSYVFDAVRFGASGFLVKDIEPADLVHAIRVVHRGDALLAPAVTRTLIEEFAVRAKPALADRKLTALIGSLTEREREIVTPRRCRAVQRRDRPAAVRQPGHRQDPREPSHDQSRCAGPGSTGGVRL